MIDLEKVEELTKALQEGKTIENNDKSVSAKLINGILVEFINGNPFGLNAGIKIGECKIQEPEPEFEITPNQLAEYECRDGSKVVCYGVALERYKNYPYRVLYHDGAFESVTINGRIDISVEMSNDLVRKIRDL